MKDLSSLTRDRTRGPCTWSLGHQGSPPDLIFKLMPFKGSSYLSTIHKDSAQPPKYSWSMSIWFPWQATHKRCLNDPDTQLHEHSGRCKLNANYDATTKFLKITKMKNIDNASHVGHWISVMLLVGVEVGTIILENRLAVSIHLKHMLFLWFSNSHHRCIFQRNEKISTKRFVKVADCRFFHNPRAGNNSQISIRRKKWSTDTWVNSTTLWWVKEARPKIIVYDSLYIMFMNRLNLWL